MTEERFARAEAQYLDEDRHRGHLEFRCSVCREESDKPICDDCQKDTDTAVKTLVSVFKEIDSLIKR